MFFHELFHELWLNNAREAVAMSGKAPEHPAFPMDISSVKQEKDVVPENSSFNPEMSPAENAAGPSMRVNNNSGTKRKEHGRENFNPDLPSYSHDVDNFRNGRNRKYPNASGTSSYPHLDLPVQTDKHLFECTYGCGKVYSRRSRLNDHIRTHHTGETPHVCTTCGRACPNAYDLRIHVLIHTGEKPYECPTCGKAFRTNKSLGRHRRTHLEGSNRRTENRKYPSPSRAFQLGLPPPSGKSIYECSYGCGKVYSRKTRLNGHIRTQHTGDTPHVCTTCGKGFPNAYDLRVHLLIHTGEKPYECPTCGKSFRTNKALGRHKRTHIGKNRFECTECGKCFTQPSDLSKHLSIHTAVTAVSTMNARSSENPSRIFFLDNSPRYPFWPGK